MNLRQQFFWKVIIGFSLILILFYSFQTYQNYNQFSKYQKEYKRELQVKENKDLQNKADYVSSKQNARNSLEINILEIQKLHNFSYFLFLFSFLVDSPIRFPWT